MTMRPLNDSLNRDILMDGSQGAFKRPGYHRQNSVISRFDSLRRLYSENSYYDPYQQEQVQQQKQQQGKRKKMDDDDGGDDGSKEATGDHRRLVNSGEQQHQDSGRPAKRRKSFTSMVKSGVIQGVLFGSALALTAFDYIQVTTTPLKRSTSSLFYSTETLTGSPMDENNNNSWFAGRSLPTTTTSKNMRGHGVDFISYFQLSPNFEKRMQKAEHLIRNICLDQQYALTQHFAPPPTPSRATQEDRCWGLINKDDYDVNFTTLPPSQPTRSFARLHKQKSFFNMA